ncbi:hypothetical protein [Streptacidiphilus albus]|uniref:hypothetical protein n=1 Tax=Streptacidiphilus albus TaxID=105425 RepID=UPI00054BA4C0|nr:hypothetical protein [Streptacidiphilus albus]
MSSDIEAAFAQELRAAAESAVQPAPGDIYAGAVVRGRRIRRTAIVKRTLASVAALGVVAAVGVPLLTGGHGPTVVGAAAAPTVKIKTTPTADDTKKAAAAQAGTAWMPAYMEQTLKSLLPAGSDTSIKDDEGDNGRIQASVPTLINIKGTSGGRAQTGLKTSTGTSAVVLITSMDNYQVHCPTAAEAPHETCTKTSVNGGTLIVDLGFKNSLNGQGATIWDVYWYGPSGQSVHLDEVTDAAHAATQAAGQALTAQQMTAIVTSPAWDRIGQSLPAQCKFGVMAGTVNSPTVIPGTVGLVCATSRSAAIPGNGEAGISIAG